MKLSVVIPAHNEEGCVESTVVNLHQALTEAQIEHELVVVNDHSTDSTGQILSRLSLELPQIKQVINQGPGGFGYAIRCGLDVFTGDVVAIYMADASDTPQDLIRFFRTLQTTGVDCLFGTRFSPESRVVDYPPLKLALNRLANLFIQVVFGIPYNDTTNAFKMYRSHVIQGLRPLISPHFNLTVEMPLKAIIRGYSYRVVPNDWINRKTGVSKLKIKEMGSRYLFIVICCLMEKWLSRGDYKQKAPRNQESEHSPLKNVS